MKSIILIMMLISVNAVAGSRRHCPNCYNPYPQPPIYVPMPYPVYQGPYVIQDEVESMCLTKMSACTSGQSGASFYYKFNYGYKEQRVVIFSNGKTSRYNRHGVAQQKEYVDLTDLKDTNAKVAVGTSDGKVTDEKVTALRVCKSEQEVLAETYGYCK